METQIIDVLQRVQIPKEFTEWALDQIKKENKEEKKDRNQILKNQQKKFNECVRKIDALIDMRANNELSGEEFAHKKAELTKEKARLQELLEDTNKRVDQWFENAEKLFNFGETAKEAFENGEMEQRREILSALGSNLLLKDGILRVSLANPIILLEPISNEVEKVHKRLEPLKEPINKRALAIMYDQSPDLLLNQKFLKLLRLFCQT